jgi:hypothetical protein
MHAASKPLILRSRLASPASDDTIHDHSDASGTSTVACVRLTAVVVTGKAIIPITHGPEEFAALYNAGKDRALALLAVRMFALCGARRPRALGQERAVPWPAAKECARWSSTLRFSSVL